MAKFLNAHGIEVSAADAKFGDKLRPGFKEIISDGEYIHSNIMLIDGKPKSQPDETSIDAMLKATIVTLAAERGQTTTEYLASLPYGDLERLAAETATKVVSILSGRGIAAKLGDAQAHIRTKLDQMTNASRDSMRRNRFAQIDGTMPATAADARAARSQRLANAHKGN